MKERREEKREGVAKRLPRPGAGAESEFAAWTGTSSRYLSCFFPIIIAISVWRGTSAPTPCGRPRFWGGTTFVASTGAANDRLARLSTCGPGRFLGRRNASSAAAAFLFHFSPLHRGHVCGCLEDGAVASASNNRAP